MGEVERVGHVNQDLAVEVRGPCGLERLDAGRPRGAVEYQLGEAGGLGEGPGRGAGAGGPGPGLRPCRYPRAGSESDLVPE